MPDTLAKRLASIILLAAGLPNERIADMTGLCNRSVRGLRGKLKGGEVAEELLRVGGGGRKRKLEGMEEFIVGMIEANNYHSLQEIADMVYEERGVKVHRTAVARLLKKTASGG
jgi:transposase